ncbi:MAG: response regulator, partial [Enterovibrio sp.]
KVIVCLPSTEIILSEKLISIGTSACLMTPVNVQKLLAYLQSKDICLPSPERMLPLLPKPATTLEKRVLAVDDNHANLKLLNMLLQNHNCATVLASSGKEALYLAQREAFSLILMDIQMPELDGVATCRAIRQTALNADTPVVAVTAHAMPHDKALLQAQGMDDYLTKPIDEAILAQVIAIWGHARSTFNAKSSQPKQQDYTSSLDWQQALRLACNKEDLAKELLELLVDSFAPIQQQINDALQEKPVDLTAVIHKFHGSCAYCGVPRLAALCFEIETALKQGVPTRYLEPELYELLDEMRNVQKEADELLGQCILA